MLVTGAVVSAGNVAVKANVAVPALAKLTVVLMLPVPFTCPQLDPLDAVQVHETFVRIAGTLSTTVAPVTGLGPSLVTVIVYVNGAPGIGCVGVAVLAMRRLDWEITVSVSLAELLPDAGSVEPDGLVMVAVLVSVPRASAATVAVTVKVALPPFARLTVVLMLPVPVVAPQLEPLEAKHDQVALVSLAGKMSTTAAPDTALGPLLVTPIV